MLSFLTVQGPRNREYDRHELRRIDWGLLISDLKGRSEPHVSPIANLEENSNEDEKTKQKINHDVGGFRLCHNAGDRSQILGAKREQCPSRKCSAG
jgi:hypothetical protein